MADVTRTHNGPMDDSDKGFVQGDCSVGRFEDDASLSPLLRVQKFAQSTNVFHRQMVMRLVQEIFRTSPADALTKDLPEIMKTLTKIGEESSLRAELLEHVPQIAAQAVECSTRVEALKNIVSDYLIPLVVRNLGYSDTAVDKAAHVTLISLIEQGFINKQQAEIQVCPAVLALATVESSADINTRAISLMSKLAPLLGRDITERVFLKRFIDLCSSPMFYMRKICAAHFGDFCAVVGKDSFENILLPYYINLCCDDVWGVRKACAEVVMFISCPCPPKARKSVLAPVFIKLLKDDCRWVRMSAFQALGPFISTFADPTITNVGYNKGGDLVLKDEEGGEFIMNSSRILSLTERYSILTNDKEEVDVMMNPLNSDLNNLSNSDSSELDDKSDEWYLEGLLKIQGLLDEEPNPNEITNQKCVTLAEIVNNELKDDFENLDISEDILNSDSFGSSETEPSHSNPSCLEDDTMNNDSSNIKSDGADNKSHLEKLYSTINLGDSLNVSSIENDSSTISIEEKDSLSDEKSPDLKNTSENSEPDQDIVPQELINHYVSMTDPNLSMNIDNEMTYHCAYSLPAVASTLGSNNWHLLKSTVDSLASDMQYKVRKTVASGLHELALILGPEAATTNLTPLFDGFIKDLDEVRIGVLKHLAHFLKLIDPTKRNAYLPRLAEFLQTDNEWNWRFREELAKQLLDAVRLFKPSDSTKFLGVIAIDLFCDKVAAVRQAAISLICEIVKYTSSEPALAPCLLLKLAETLAHSKKWKRRQTFCLLCIELLKEEALSTELFASEILPHLLDLSWDPVINVRLVVARCISQQIMENEYFADPSNEHHESLQTVLRRLQADKDIDVRQSAGV
ncbi:serine/threonine-protein phosphatase 4 regulatory subunit 1 isoform X3 [Leptinotarsa decemlineata]|uniref:serine/threonine-protein phosphatase 4 regulatory subunit 1 isoform X3 n=1 Tax=Leptinotarsa decemlineata TaxID=7539 RepID=UPI003D3071BD